MPTTRTSHWKAFPICAAVAVLGACSDDDGDAPSIDSGVVAGDDASTTDSGSVAAGDRGDAASEGDAGSSPDASADGGAIDGQTLVDVAIADGRFTSLVAAVQKAELVEALRAPGPLTVFAPTDDAFAALLSALGTTLDQLTADDLTPILTYHVLDGEVTSTDLTAGPVKMLSGISAFVSLEGGAKINGADVLIADVEASNGVIHVIDEVILPPNLVEAATLGGFDTLAGAVASAGLADALAAQDANLTLFAPTDAAFSALPSVPTGDALRDVLLYHVVMGKVLSTELTAGMVPTLLTNESITVNLTSGVRIDDATVTAADIVATNGVIHQIDAVLLPTN